MTDLRTATDNDLDLLEAKLTAERARREEERKVVFPLETTIGYGASKTAMEQVAESLHLPEETTNNFRYAFLNLEFKVRIEQDGTTCVIGFKAGHMADYFLFPDPINVMCS